MTDERLDHPAGVPAYIPSHRKADIMFIGRSPTTDDLVAEQPFTGTDGRELNRMFRLAGVVRNDVALTNLFHEPIPGNDIEQITLPTVELKAKLKEDPPDPLFAGYDLPPIVRGRYLHPEWAFHLHRLADEIEAVNPNLIVPLGNEALWAVTGDIGIAKFRGSVGMTTAPWLRTQRKMLATYHPSHVLGKYRDRITVIADLMKAIAESQTPELYLPKRTLWLEPTLDDIRAFKREHLDPAETIAVDIETAKGQITCIAFAPSPYLSITIPFTDWRANWSYWPSFEEELEAWKLVKSICHSPNAKVLQNGLYDVYWLWMKLRIKVLNYLHDTRLLHHALYPELPKSLLFMGSIYENERAWKNMRARKASKTDE